MFLQVRNQVGYTFEATHLPTPESVSVGVPGQLLKSSRIRCDKIVANLHVEYCPHIAALWTCTSRTQNSPGYLKLKVCHLIVHCLAVMCCTSTQATNFYHGVALLCIG